MRHFDLCVVGSGSGNSIPDKRFDDLSIAIVEKGVYGGTCLNVGCIPTKMFVYPADLAASSAHAQRLGVDLRFGGVRWAEIRDRIFGRIDQISRSGEQWRMANANVTLYRKEAHFTGPKTLDTGEGEAITADRFVIAAGSRVVIPDIPGIENVTIHTSDTVMRLDRLPHSMIILGGGYVSAEFAHIFSAFGTDVTVINRSGALLRNEDGAISKRFTELIGKRVNVLLNRRVDRLEARADGRVGVHVVNTQDATPDDAQGAVPAGGETLEADVFLVATGRRPNGDTLNLSATGVEMDDEGYVIVDRHQCTTAKGIFALGDVSSHDQLKHVANYEMRLVRHNLLHPDDMRSSDDRPVPHAVFSEPQVASVGLTEEQAREQGIPYVAAVHDYGSVAYGWAMEDTDHFAKLLAEPKTGRILGAHIIGPQASSLIQPLIQAMSWGIGAKEMAAGQYWIHPAMVELVENALIALPIER